VSTPLTCPSCEDDPERAVRCGLAILEAMKELALDVRVGVNTGQAVVADGWPDGRGGPGGMVGRP
jgi:class 3 adenylate cyclase